MAGEGGVGEGGRDGKERGGREGGEDGRQGGRGEGREEREGKEGGGEREGLCGRKGWAIRSGASTGWRCTLHLVESAECSRNCSLSQKPSSCPRLQAVN